MRKAKVEKKREGWPTANSVMVYFREKAQKDHVRNMLRRAKGKMQATTDDKIVTGDVIIAALESFVGPLSK